MQKPIFISLVLLFGLAIEGHAIETTTSKKIEPADTIYTNGIILILDDVKVQPEDEKIAEAVAVRDGRIVGVGTAAEITAKFSAPNLVDLDGNTLLPGFVDPHAHAYGIGLQNLSANLLAPPDGSVENVGDSNDMGEDTLLGQLKEWANENPASTFEWVLGFGYDESQLDSYPTAADLDLLNTIVGERPIYIIHQSGHFGVANSVAMSEKYLNITSCENDEIPGGVIRCDEEGKPNGVLEENAHFDSLTKLLGSLSQDDHKFIFRKGIDTVASYGYTTAQEGRATPELLILMESVAEQDGGLKIDVVAYADAITTPNSQIQEKFSRSYTNGFRVGGSKLTIDGSPQGKTAWSDEPYYVPPAGQDDTYAGYPAVEVAQVTAAMEAAFKGGWQILTHANGEAAIDVLINAVRAKTFEYGRLDRRPVLIHGAFLREDQVEELKRWDIFPSLFPMHTFYWGKWHLEQTAGPIQGHNIAPTGWVLNRGMKFTSHHDAPVANPDSMRVLSATVTRIARDMDEDGNPILVGPEHKVPVNLALRAMTIWSAWQYFEEKDKGSIEVGKLADFVVLNQNPLTTPKEELSEIKILSTIKEDKVVYPTVPARLTTARWNLTTTIKEDQVVYRKEARYVTPIKSRSKATRCSDSPACLMKAAAAFTAAGALHSCDKHVATQQPFKLHTHKAHKRKSRTHRKQH
jgi:predicted amidohydrolase YtcJ